MSLAAAASLSVWLSGPGVGRAATQADKTAPTTYSGPETRVGNGVAHSWLLVDGECRPAELGLSFSASALTGLPSTMPTTEYALLLPPQASRTPFTHIVINWNPMGHIPPAVYTVPHFDFHFYIITPEIRSGIATTDQGLARVQKKPAADYLPANYIYATGGEEPRMGAHWVDPGSPEFHGEPFTSTFIYGTYDGALAFLEPMASLEYIQTKPTFLRSVSTPKRYAVPGYYPTSYGMRYDSAAQVYSVYLAGFVKR